MQPFVLNKDKRISIKQDVQGKRKSVLPFSKQLLNLQKKIQEVEDKNQLILQRIHKAYDFKKSKNKVYFEAPEYGQDEQQDAQFQQVQFEPRGSYKIKPITDPKMYQNIQSQQYQPRQFDLSTGKKNNLIQSKASKKSYYQNINNHNSYLQNNQSQNQYFGQQAMPLVLGLPTSPFYPEHLQNYPEYLQQQEVQKQKGHQKNGEHQNSPLQSQSSQGQVDFKSNSNYSDVERRIKISENVKKRQKDFSDIKSNIQQRITKPSKIQTKNNGKKSYIFNVIENNSLYSEGNMPSKQHLEGDDLQPVQTPITVQPNASKMPQPKSPYRKQVTPIASQQQLPMRSSNQIPRKEYFAFQNQTMTSLPHPSARMTYSLTGRNQQIQSQVSPNELNFLQQMFKTQRQKSMALEKQVEKKQQSIQHLKKYKKSFRRFFQDTHYVIEQAFDQFVETFLRNRVYKIQKMVKKNENRLSALIIQLKDFKQERIYTRNIKSLSTKTDKKSISISDNTHRRSQQTQSQEDQGINEQNYSSIMNRSRDRSVSARKRRSQDKSLTKKSNQSLIMKKQFDNIAQNYQAMIKVKNEEIQRFQSQIKQAKTNILNLQDENNKLKLLLQQFQNQAQVSQNIQQQTPLTTSNLQIENNSRRNSGNLRILSRNSSRNQIKKNTNSQESQQLSNQKIKKYKEEVEALQQQNTSLQTEIVRITQNLTQKQSEIQNLMIKLKNFENQITTKNKLKFQQFQQQIQTLNQKNQQINAKNTELLSSNNQLKSQIQSLSEKINQKQIKILQLDSSLYLKNSELKKVQNLLTLKTQKLQEFNKLLLQPSGNQPLNDSMSSVMEDPHNKTTFLMLQNLEKQLEEEKQEKQIEFLKLKKSYEIKIQQLKTEFQQIAHENQKLAQRLNQDQTQKAQLEQDRIQLQQIIQNLKEEVDDLHKEIGFLTDKVNFYEAQRKTGSFTHIPKRSDTLLLKSDSNPDLLKPHLLQEHDFEDFPIGEQNSNQLKQNDIIKTVSAKLINESPQSSILKGKKSPSEQNQNQIKMGNQNQINQNLQNKLSLLKDQNIELSQKIAKLQKQNKFLKQNESENSSRFESVKDQLAGFTKKYEELQLYNQELLKIVQNLQNQKNEILSLQKDHHEQAQKNLDVMDLKGSANYSPLSLASRQDFLLDRTSKDFDIKGSIISNFMQNRPSKESQQSEKKIEQLTKKLSETELLLQNKQKINEQLIIGFTKKIDKINTENKNQAKQQAKVIQKYIQQNSKLRKQKQKIEEELQTLKNEVSKLKQKLRNQQNFNLSNFESGVQEINIEKNENQQPGFDLLEQRIQDFQGHGFMLGINQVDHQAEKLAQKDQKVQFQTILEQENIQFQDFEQKQQKIELLEKQNIQLQETIQKLQKFLEETLNKVKQKEDEKTGLVQELQKKNQQVEELRDLIELKQVGKNTNLSISKQLNGIVDRPSIQKSHRSRMNSVVSLKYSQTNHGQRQRRASFDDEINFDFLETNNNQSLNLEHSRMSAIYSQNMSTIFQKEQNFLDQIKKAKNKRKQEGKLLKKTFEYIKKLRTTLNDKNKKIRLLQMRLQQLKDNCWLWGKNNQRKTEEQNEKGKVERLKTLSKNQGSNQGSQQHNYFDHNQSLSEDGKDKLVDSRVFECNSQDLNKKKPYRHNHYKKMEFDTKLIIEENKILNKQIQLLQQELIKIEEQQNGLMAVKELYKEQIRALTRQNQQQATFFQNQIQKLQEKIESSEAVHNFDAIKQLFKRIIDSIGVILNPNISPQSKKKNINQLKEQKRKQAEECTKVICSILNYDDTIRNQICQRLATQQRL